MNIYKNKVYSDEHLKHKTALYNYVVMAQIFLLLQITKSSLAKKHQVCASQHNYVSWINLFIVRSTNIYSELEIIVHKVQEDCLLAVNSLTNSNLFGNHPLTPLLGLPL